MKKLEWQDDWLTGVHHLDEQHKKLINTVNKALDRLHHHPNSPEIEEVLDELSAYARTHFKDEEKFLEENGYEQSPSHIKHHVQYQKDLSAICMNVANRVNATNDEIVSHALLWWGKHILIEDLRWATKLGTIPR